MVKVIIFLLKNKNHKKPQKSEKKKINKNIRIDEFLCTFANATYKDMIHMFFNKPYNAANKKKTDSNIIRFHTPA
jgi:hypothetical protein